MDTNNQFPTDSEVENGKVVEKTNSSSKNSGDTQTKIKVGKVDSLVIYEVSEGELETIERGSPNSTYLNFSVFLLSIFISFLIALLTCEFTNNERLFNIFLIVCVIGGLMGIFLFIIWYRTKNDVDTVIKKIKQRIIE